MHTKICHDDNHCGVVGHFPTRVCALVSLTLQGILRNGPSMACGKLRRMRYASNPSDMACAVPGQAQRRSRHSLLTHIWHKPCVPTSAISRIDCTNSQHRLDCFMVAMPFRTMALFSSRLNEADNSSPDSDRSAADLSLLAHATSIINGRFSPCKILRVSCKD